MVNRFFEKSGEAMSLRSISEALLSRLCEEYPEAALKPLEEAMPPKEEEDKDKKEKASRPPHLPATQVHQIMLTATSSTGEVLDLRALAGTRFRARGVGEDGYRRMWHHQGRQPGDGGGHLGHAGGHGP